MKIDLSEPISFTSTGTEMNIDPFTVTSTTVPYTITTGTTPFTITATDPFTATATATISTQDWLKARGIEPKIMTGEFVAVKDIVKKKDKLDPRIVKINREIEELKKKTSFSWIKEYVPNKVYGFKFRKNDKEYKTICAEEDTFDLEFAFFLALAKWFTVLNLTTEGYVHQAKQLSYNKNHIKEVKDGIKLFHKLQEKEALEEQIKAEKKHRHDKLVAKKIAKKERKKNEQYEIIKAAIEDSKS